MTSTLTGPGNRPFHFMVPFWGERYRNYFIDLFLPSLLAPNNLRLLQAKDGHKFFIAAPREDWEAIKDLPIMSRARRHVEPSWVEVSSQPHEQTGSEHERYAAVLRHMKTCLRTVLDAGYHPRAYGSFHLPDTVFSDGMVASLLASVHRGDRLVVCPALRQSEEGVLAEIDELGLWSHNPAASITARELTLMPRRAADMAVRHLHPEVLIFEEGALGQPATPPFRYWRVPEGRGILLNTFFVAPVLMDYSGFSPDHTRCLDHDSFENAYISANFGDSAVIRIVEDSDDFVMLSLTPKSVDHSAPSSDAGRRSALRRYYDCLCDIRRSFEIHAVHNRDVIRQKLGRTLVRWHAHDLDDEWMKLERRLRRVLDRAIGDYYERAIPQGRLAANRHNWRTVILDTPVFDLPRTLRRLIYRVLLKVRATGGAFINARGRGW